MSALHFSLVFFIHLKELLRYLIMLMPARFSALNDENNSMYDIFQIELFSQYQCSTTN